MKLHNQPLRNLHELSFELNTPERSLIATLASEAAAGRPIPAAFRPNGRAKTYYNPNQFSKWFKSLTKKEATHV